MTTTPATTLPDAARLITAGWTQTRSNRWTHPALPASPNRLKLFTLEAALALVNADPTQAAATP